jgi:hypothetical protein
MGWFTKDIVKNGVYAYLATPVVVNVPTAGVYVAIPGSFVNDPIYQFHLGTDAIIYDGLPCWFKIDFHATFSSEDAGRTIHMAPAINGEILTEASPQIMAMYAKYAAEDLMISGTYVVWLETGVGVSLKLTSTTNDDNVTVSHFTTSMRKFYR